MPVHGPQRMSPNDFGDLLTFSPSDQNFHFYALNIKVPSTQKYVFLVVECLSFTVNQNESCSGFDTRRMLHVYESGTFLCAH